MKPQLFKSALGLAFLASLLAAPIAFAQDAPQNCKTALDALGQEYAETGLSSPTKPSGGMMRGVNGHTHSGAEMTVMRTHFMEAQHTCEAGKDHESMLHQDVVRAILNLPPVDHPASHHYKKPVQQ